MEYVKLLGKVLPHLRPVLPYLKPVLYQLVPYEIRVGQLAKDVNKLRKVKTRVHFKVKEEANRNERAIDNGVIKWLEEADVIISDYENFCEDEDRPYAVFSDGYLPKPAIRYHLSGIVNDIARRVNVQLQSTKNDEFSYWLGPPSFGADFDNIRYEMFPSRNQTTADIMAALADSNVGMIGVHGQSGAGKTSLIKQIAKKMKLKGKMFDLVIMVNLTSRPDIRRIQRQIADKLGMILEEESESGRAAELRERLKDPKEKTLIILDNMGVKLDFNMLGIPSLNNDDSQMNQKMKNPSSHNNYAMKTEEFDASSSTKTEEPLARCKGCKILMISNSEQLLLSHEMDGKGIKTFCVQPLTEKESETMFKTMAEIGDANSQFQTLAAQIANKCKGLPMTLVTTANALKKKSLPVWVDVYQKLERQNITETPEFSTKLSYDLLETEDLKHTFLICARMGHDALITDLVRYCIGLGLLQGICTVREARHRVHALVAKLKELSLLSDSFSSDRFTMQDIIRDAALSIASQQMHAFAVTKGKLDEWPDVDKLERYTAISLQNCDVSDIIEEFPKKINYFRLRVFHLDNKDPRLKIPDEIFIELKELRVLILTGIHLSPLPSSIKCLTKLRMLCLERCKLGGRLSIIGGLKKLRVLSLSGSDIACLPVELRDLAKLQIFDISNCFILKEIPADVLPSLTSLEELYMGNSPIQWKDEGGQGIQSGNASLSELRQLNQLTALDIQIPKVTYLPKNLLFDKLDSYRIVIRDFNPYPMLDFNILETCEASRYLALQLENGISIHCQEEIKRLFGRVENLLLGQLNDVEDIFYELNYEGFPYLKYLSIVSNSKVQSIINSKNQKHPEKAFPKLESLFLYEVNNMEHICHSQLTNDSFCKLKIIRLKICCQLKNVFFSSMIKHLSALETIEVSECNSLKEIVTSEVESGGDKINFPELRSLTLHSLSEFIGFYTDGASTGVQVPHELFHEKVVISKLERMELSSIKIQNIWSDQSLTSFHNLIHLDVNDCWNLRYLLSFSMSKSLTNLKSLFVSECGMMENIFEFIQAENKIEERIFPKLKNINLRSMKRLRQIWHPKFPSHCFAKLDALIIEGCNKLENVFPSYMVGRFQSLCNLRVTNCKSMKEIFDLKGCRKQNVEVMTNLQSVHVEALPKLEHVWNEDPKGILKFKNLEKIWVRECLNIKHIFPVSMAMDLKKLEHLEVWNCGQLKEIVFRGETNNASSDSFEFPKLTTARFSKLPNLENFYGGTHELCCSTLNNLSVENCHNLKLFRTEIANSEIMPVFLPEKEIYNLKSMQIEPRDANSLKRYMGNYRMNKLEEFQLSRLVDTEILYFFLYRNPILESLLLSNCFFEKLVPPRNLVEENSGVVPKLKSLKLINLPSLEMIGFEEDTVLFQMLECLILKECPCLNVIAPSSVSFAYLTNLEVSNCNKLRYLLTPSTTKSLVQLTAMKVTQCELMEAIVSEQENIERINIIFTQLKEIELDALHELGSFCSSYRCAIEFPCLEKVVVSACGKMETFTSSGQLNKTPKLRQICVRHGKEEKGLYWEGDLNATIKRVYKIRAVDPEDMAASNPYGALESFRLKTLKLVNHKLGPYAIPTAVFPSLKNLEELEVGGTDVAVIFGIHDTKMKGYPFPLKKLTLDNLPNLIQVWDRDKDREGILSFQNLQEVRVTNCENLQTLFPSELAKRVKKLHKLEIRQCEMFLDIVEEENAEFSFPRLTSLDLRMLPRLTRFYPGEPIFILESLKLDWNNTMMLFNRNFAQVMLHELVELELDFNYYDNVLWDFAVKLIEKASNLEYLQISRCKGLEELFLGGMKSRRDSTSLPLVCKELQKLCVSCCPDLTTLVHSAVSFSNLKHLSIKDCHELKHLFTSSTARQLVHLEEMYVVQCKSMVEIILAQVRHETTSEAIKFERLNTIVLDSLSSLSCFYSGSDTLQLSSLRSVLVLKCPEMWIFSRGAIHAESFVGIQVSLDPNEDLLFHQDLNTTVKWIFQREEFLKCLDKNYFSRNHEQLVLDGNVGLQNKWLCDLVTLKLDKCILRYAIPSGILPHLKNLQELEVRNSNQVEVIFDTEIMETTSKLKKLTLKGLQGLTHVWEKNCKGLLIYRNLQEVNVSCCENLQTLFPASLAKNLKELEKLEIKCCLELQAIVEKEEGTAANATEEFVFPRLHKLYLHNLPQVTYFYPQTFTLERPTLKILSVLDCHKLELFQTEGEGTSTSINGQLLISNLKVISNLNKLRLDWKHISALSSRFSTEQFTYGLNYLKHISLWFFDAGENEMPIEILQKAPNLTEMSMDYCNKPKIWKDWMLEQLTILTLNDVWKLQSIKSEDESLLNTICEKLHKLKVLRCPDLTTLVHSTSTVSFSCLKQVFISECAHLQYLFTSSAAKLLMNLEEITVKECESVKEIVAVGEDATSEGIEFERLHTIVLDSLPSLICFYSGSGTLRLSFLIKVHIRECSKMKIFSQGVVYAKSFSGIQMLSDPKEEDLLFHQDLNATIKGMFQRREFFERLDNEQAILSGDVGLQKQNEWLCNLKTLKLVECTLPYAIPSAILPHINNLKELEVRDSDIVEVIFDTEIIETESLLQKLTLKGLSKLTRVWGKNSQRVGNFGNLHEVIVSGCENLRTLFPASLAENLKELEKLEIESCDKLQEIVEKKEGTAANVTEKFVFPRLQKLSLNKLPRVTYFYPQTFTLECPALKILSVLDCHELELFQSTSINRQPLISNLKAISKLKELELDWKHISALSFRFASDQFVPGEAGLLAQLTTLTLNDVQKLESSDSENLSWLNTICEKLHELNVFKCLHLTTLVHPTVSFSCLKKVFISECAHLQYLFTSSAAKKLMNLEEIKVMKCDSLKEIVAKKEGEGEMIFSKLKRLTLVSLPKFESFYMGSFTLKFPSLKQLWFDQCYSTKLFRSRRDQVPEKLDVTKDGVYLKDDINSVIMQQLEEEAA